MALTVPFLQELPLLYDVLSTDVGHQVHFKVLMLVKS